MSAGVRWIAIALLSTQFLESPANAQIAKEVDVTPSWYPDRPPEATSKIEILLTSPSETLTGSKVTVAFKEGVLRRRLIVDVTTAGAPDYLSGKMTFRAHRYLDQDELVLYAPIVKTPAFNDSAIADNLIRAGSASLEERELFAYYLQARYVVLKRIEIVGVPRATKRDVRLAREVMHAATRLGNTQQYALRTDEGLEKIVSWLRQLQEDAHGIYVLSAAFGDDWKRKLELEFLALDGPETRDFLALWTGISTVSDPFGKYSLLVAYREAFMEVRTSGSKNVLEQAVVSRPDIEMAIASCLDQLLRESPARVGKPIDQLSDSIKRLSDARNALATDTVYTKNAFLDRLDKLKNDVEARRSELVEIRTALESGRKLAPLDMSGSNCVSRKSRKI
jgi:hypothetical protein